MINRTACQCGACRARTDGAFWRIAGRLPDVEYRSLEIIEQESAPMVARIKEYSEEPRAETAEEFAAWLERIIDRARRRTERDGS